MAAGFGHPGHYHEPSPAKVSDLEALAWEVLESEVGEGFFTSEGAMVWAARDLCGLVGKAGGDGSDHELDGRMVEQALLARGVTDSRAEPFAAGATSPGAVVEVFSSHVSGDPARYSGRIVGIGTSEHEGRHMLCAIAVERGVELEPFPRSLDLPGSAVLEGISSPSVSSMNVLVASPDGDVVDMALAPSGFSVTLDMTGGQGVYMIELVGDEGAGSEIMNLFPVVVGKAGGVAKVVLSVPWRDGPSRNAWMLFDLVNAHRVEHGLLALSPDPDLSGAALSHCRDMRDAGYFGHVSPTMGDVQQRTSSIPGIASVAEAMALAISPARAFKNLVSSPVHAAVLRSPGMTAMGVGKVETPDGMLFTVIVASRP